MENGHDGGARMGGMGGGMSGMGEVTDGMGRGGLGGMGGVEANGVCGDIGVPAQAPKLELTPASAPADAVDEASGESFGLLGDDMQTMLAKNCPAKNFCLLKVAGLEIV